MRRVAYFARSRRRDAGRAIASRGGDAEERERTLGAGPQEAPRVAEHRHELGDEALVRRRILGDDGADLVIA